MLQLPSYRVPTLQGRHEKLGSALYLAYLGL